MVIWITGLAGAGKTTLGLKVVERLKERGKFVVFLDGDDFREIFGNDLGYDAKDRLENARRISRTCRFLAHQGMAVVCATMSLFRECHDWNRKNISGYFEVFLDVSTEVLVQRNKKNLYSRALKGEMPNVVGINLECEFPQNPDLVLNGDVSLHQWEYLANTILEAVL